jgi:hypothetical protein
MEFKENIIKIYNFLVIKFDSEMDNGRLMKEMKELQEAAKSVSSS